MRKLSILFAVLLLGCADPELEPDAGPPPPPPSDAGPGVDAGYDEPDPFDAGVADAGPADDIVGDCGVDMTPLLTILGVPGLSGGLLVNGELDCTITAGFADVESGSEVAPDTVFRWGSVSTTLTATVVLALIDEGLLSLDDDVQRHVPFDVRSPDCDDEPITIRHLMTHTSAIRDVAGPYEAQIVAGDPEDGALGRFLREYLDRDGDHYDDDDNFLSRCPGERYHPTNIGMALLGYVAEHVTGTPLHQLARERVLTPIGAGDASFRIADIDPARLAIPYRRDTGLIPLPHKGTATYPDGALRASVPEMARLLATWAGGGAIDGTRVLSIHAVTEASRRHIPSLDGTQGLVWFYDHDDVLGHAGTQEGASAMMFFDPATSDGALLVANGAWDEAAARTLFEELLAEARVR